MENNESERTQLLERLAGIHIDHCLLGTANQMDDYLLTPGDGRKRRPVMRRLQVEGYVEVLQPSSPSMKTNVFVRVTDKAFGFMEAKKPDLLAKIEDFLGSNMEGRVGVPWSGLSVEEKKYVLLHKDEYTFCITDRRGQRVDIIPGEGSYREQVFKVFGLSYSEQLVQVYTPEVSARVAMFCLEQRVEALLTPNLAWGLAKLGLLSEEEAKP